MIGNLLRILKLNQRKMLLQKILLLKKVFLEKMNLNEILKY